MKRYIPTSLTLLLSLVFFTGEDWSLSSLSIFVSAFRPCPINTSVGTTAPIITSSCGMSTTAAAAAEVADAKTAASNTIDGSASFLHSVLKKPSKVLTIGVEYDDSIDTLPSSERAVLSMQLRKCKVTSIWCNTVSAVRDFAQEQATAVGNFPGPCPVIFIPNTDDGTIIETAKASIGAGASGIVVNMKDAETAQSVASLDGCEKIFQVRTVKDVETCLQMTDGTAQAYWIDARADDDENENGQDNYVTDEELLESIVTALPSHAFWIGSAPAMQTNGAEIDVGKRLQKPNGYTITTATTTTTPPRGASSMLIHQACVGDDEDVEYAQFLVNELTSKASSEFKFSGLTGSTNGHFGGVQGGGTIKWKRRTVRTDNSTST